jgi:hypothetical protein
MFFNSNLLKYTIITKFIFGGTLVCIYLQEMHMFRSSKIIAFSLLLMSIAEAYINWDPFNIDSSLFYYSVYSLFTIYLIYISFNPFK